MIRSIEDNFMEFVASFVSLPIPCEVPPETEEDVKKFVRLEEPIVPSHARKGVVCGDWQN